MEALVESVKGVLLKLPLPGIARKLIEQWVSVSFLKYLIIGLSTFLLQIVLLNFISAQFKIPAENANFISTLLCMVYNFLLSNYWTFKAGNDKQGKKIGKYLTLGTFNYVFDTVLAFPFLTLTLGLATTLAKVVITAMIVIWNFFIYKFWVFKTS